MPRKIHIRYMVWIQISITLTFPLSHKRWWDVLLSVSVAWWEKGWNIVRIKEWQQYLIILRFSWIYRKIIIWLLSLCWIMNNKILKYEKVGFILHITMLCNSILVCMVVYARRVHVGCRRKRRVGVYVNEVKGSISTRKDMTTEQQWMAS